MSILAMIARILLGLIYFIFGLNYFLNFIPIEHASEGATAFIGALVDTNYLMQLIKGIEVLCGISLLIGMFSRLALVMLFPISVGVLLFNIFLEPSGLTIGIVIFALHLFLLWNYRKAYLPLLQI